MKLDEKQEELNDSFVRKIFINIKKFKLLYFNYLLIHNFKILNLLNI